MSIHPSSDLVLDVVKAADPAKSMVMTKSLMSLGAVAEKDSGEFSTVLDRFGPSFSGLQTQVVPNRPILAVGTEPLDRATQAFKGLEQLELQKLVETMLPADAESFFGGGTAGSIWKSMLADVLAKDMSKSVDLGIAKAASMRSNYSSSFEGPDRSHEQGIKKQNEHRGL